MNHVKRNRLIILCTELAAMRAITDAAGRTFDLVWVRDGKGLREAFDDGAAPVAVIIDNAAVHESAIGLLQSVRETLPNVRRILLSDYCDLAIIVQGLHTNAVQKIVYKPVHSTELLAAVGNPPVPAAITSPNSVAPAIRAAG